MITLENADKALKDYYLQAVNTQLNDNVSPFVSAIEKNSNYVFGKDVKMSLINQSIDSVLACAEDADLPEPYQNRYVEISVPLKNIYGTIEISDKALRASRDSSGAFINLVNAEMEGLISSAKYNFQRMIYGNGKGALCTINSADSNAATNFKYMVTSAKYLTEGMKVDVVASNNTSKDEGLIVKKVHQSNNYVVFDRAVTVTAEKAIITRHGSYGNELTGLNAIFEDNKLYGHDKTAEEYFTPYVLSTAGSIREIDVLETLEYLEENYNSKINMILCSYKNKKKLVSLFANSKLMVNTVNVEGGYGTLTINGIPVYADRFCPDNRVYFVNTDDFVLNQLCDWEWLEDEDGKILKQVPGKAAYSATLVKYAELICKKPCAQAVIKI